MNYFLHYKEPTFNNNGQSEVSNLGRASEGSIRNSDSTWILPTDFFFFLDFLIGCSTTSKKKKLHVTYDTEESCW